MTKKQTISVVDLNDYLSDSVTSRNQFIQTLGDGLMDIGFFAIENHGIDHDLIAKAYKLVDQFFQQADTEKRKYEDTSIKLQRGFTSFGKEHAKDHPVPDLKEFWHVGQEFTSDHSLYNVYPKNIWPQNIPEFKETFLELYKQLGTCAEVLLKATALYLDLPENTFSEMAIDGNTILRLIHYPPVPQDVNPQSVRAAAHEDINLITLLCESTDEGLELLQPDGTWRPIHALNGQIIADAGDMLQNVTNGMIKSTTHRVVNPGNDRSRRYSMPYFVHPRSEVDLSPLPQCVARTNQEQKFPNITAGEYLHQRLVEIGLA